MSGEWTHAAFIWKAFWVWSTSTGWPLIRHYGGGVAATSPEIGTAFGGTESMISQIRGTLKLANGGRGATALGSGDQVRTGPGRHRLGTRRPNAAMTTTQRPWDGHTLHGRRLAFHQIRLNLRARGTGRVPDRRARQFHLDAFAQALERRDLDHQLAQYAPGADIRVVDPDHPPVAPRMVRGATALHAWLLECRVGDLDPEVTHLVDGGDRVAFTQRWHDREGAGVVATSTAELEDGLITTQHTNVVWGQSWT